MNIDLRKLYALSNINLKEKIIIPEDYYKNLDIIRMNPVQVVGRIFINSSDEIELMATLQGSFILPCAITLEEVKYDFNTDIDEIISKNGLNNEINLALLDILWENIVLEVPIKVIKENSVNKDIKGEGWELEA